MEQKLHQLNEEYKEIHLRMQAILELHNIGRYSISILPEKHLEEWTQLNHRLYQVLGNIKSIKRAVN